MAERPKATLDPEKARPAPERAVQASGSPQGPHGGQGAPPQGTQGLSALKEAPLWLLEGHSGLKQAEATRLYFLTVETEVARASQY